MRRKGWYRRTYPFPKNGFTLVEVLVVLVLSAIALAIAIPGFTDLIISNRLTATANVYVGAISQARLEAIKRNQRTQVCSNSSSSNTTSTLGATCGTALGAVYALNSDGTTNAIQNALTLPSGIEAANGSNGSQAAVALRFDGTGLAVNANGNGNGTDPYTGLAANFYTSRISSNNHSCVYITTGSSVSRCKRTNNNGGCPASEPTPCQQ